MATFHLAQITQDILPFCLSLLIGCHTRTSFVQSDNFYKIFLFFCFVQVFENVWLLLFAIVFHKAVYTINVYIVCNTVPACSVCSLLWCAFNVQYDFLFSSQWAETFCQVRGSFIYQDKVIGLVENIRKTPVFWSCTAGGSGVALPHIHLQRYYPSIPQYQLSLLVFEHEAT